MGKIVCWPACLLWSCFMWSNIWTKDRALAQRVESSYLWFFGLSPLLLLFCKALFVCGNFFRNFFHVCFIDGDFISIAAVGSIIRGLEICKINFIFVWRMTWQITGRQNRSLGVIIFGKKQCHNMFNSCAWSMFPRSISICIGKLLLISLESYLNDMQEGWTFWNNVHVHRLMFIAMMRLRR